MRDQDPGTNIALGVQAAGDETLKGLFLSAGNNVLASRARRCAHPGNKRTWPLTSALVCFTATRGKQFIAAACNGSQAGPLLLKLTRERD
jgi:hypothetical protein